MWLINTATLELEYVLNHESVRYAILSHTWEDGEVSFQEFQDLDKARKKAGFDKIFKTCEIARAHNCSYAWVDTCCIDKTSSAELSEAINSMFGWYKGSYICFVYLSTLPVHLTTTEPELATCRWFRRGWTLQELIAPGEIIFYDREWKPRGTKETLGAAISSITSIGIEILRNSQLLDSVPIAKRMSWVAGRTTTRPEDIAYCLLGLFDINMPLLYGEGQKAFLRLQEEICRRSKDLTLFAWETATSTASRYHGLFAQSPDDFAGAKNFERHATRTPFTKEVRLTNKGLCIEEMELRFSPGQGIFMNLECSRPPDVAATLHIRLTKTMDGYVRIDPGCLFSGFTEPLAWRLPENVYIPISLSFDDRERLNHQDTHMIKISIASERILVARTSPAEFWDPIKSAFLVACTSHGQGAYIGVVELYVNAEKGRLVDQYCESNTRELELSESNAPVLLDLHSKAASPRATPWRKNSGSTGTVGCLVLIFELYPAHMVPRSIQFQHAVVDQMSDQWSHLMDWLEQRKLSRNVREDLYDSVFHRQKGSVCHNEGLFKSSRIVSDTDVGLIIDVRKTSKDIGQIWEMTISV
ncbi:heterokaryon incompatibility protein-domain-containing protein [Xylariales sp. PMI_506]|nr:heterokaryon incompatibility protein-domain-containing protein [Xylariales sp. PMI_506]